MLATKNMDVDAGDKFAVLDGVRRYSIVYYSTIVSCYSISIV